MFWLETGGEHPFAVPIFIILARFVPPSDRLPRFSPVCFLYLHQVNLVRDGNNFLGPRPKYTSITHVLAVYSVRMFLQGISAFFAVLLVPRMTV